jgi:hypothetical protein
MTLNVNLEGEKLPDDCTMHMARFCRAPSFKYCAPVSKCSIQCSKNEVSVAGTAVAERNEIIILTVERMFE